MGDGQFLDIILFAMIAAFLVLRLRSVLGRRTGHERRPTERIGQQRRAETPARAEADAAGDNVVELPSREPRVEEAMPSDPISAGITQIRIADPSFDRDGFVKGARSAFEMIVQAFARGETKQLRQLLNDEVYDRFAAAIKEREKAGETLETTLIGIKSAEVVGAKVEGRTAFVTISFVSEQVNVTRDKQGNVVDGDPNRVADVRDIWTFARNTRARDPNWTLVETESPS